VIIMLGTNDLKKRFQPESVDVVSALLDLARLTKECEGGIRTVYPSPQILVIAPPPPAMTFRDPEQWSGAHKKSLGLGAGTRSDRCARSRTRLTKLVFRLGYNDDVARGQLAVF
jgi:hypothetical protein